VAALAHAQGLLRAEPAHLTVEAMAEALAGPPRERGEEPERRWPRTEGDDHAG
jgi:hypothetical protein